MKITATQQAGVCVVFISGNVDSLTSAEMGKFLDGQIEQGPMRMVLGLTEVN
jgi:hypothetical protein